MIVVIILLQSPGVFVAKFLKNHSEKQGFEVVFEKFGWASWMRTNACRSQSAMPYRLAIAQ